MADAILVQEASATFQSPLSPQRSQHSLYSTPELVPGVDLYQTGSSLGSKPHDASTGLSSSFVLISDESHSAGGDQPLSSEYVEVSEGVVNKSLCQTHDQALEVTASTTADDSSAKRGTDASGASPLCLPTVGGVDSTSEVQKWLEVSVQHSNSTCTAGAPTETTSNLGGLLPLKPKITTLAEAGTQTGCDHPLYVRVGSRDGTTQTLPEIKDSEEKRQPTVAATTPTSILDHAGLHDQISPLNSPSDEVVDMSASTVLIERHISQKEGRMLKNSNKELRLKIKKLTEVLEQMQKENKRLRNEIESGGPAKIAEAQSALNDKEREHKQQIEELEEQQEMEIEQYRKEIQRAAEYEERAEEKFKENAQEIAELRKTISGLKEQLLQAQDKSQKYSKEVEALTMKLKACETKASVTESENSVLSEKVNRLMKELAALKKGKHHHHHVHHHHQQYSVSDEKSKEHAGAPSSNNAGQDPPPIKDQSTGDVASKSGKEQEQLTKQEKQEKPASASQFQSEGDDTTKPAAHDLKASQPKPKPRQKQSYQPHNPQLQALASSISSKGNASGLNQKSSKPREGRPPNRPVQALVAPKLQSVAHLQPLNVQQLPTGAKYGQEYLPPHYYYHHEEQQLASKPTPPKVHGASASAAAMGRVVDRPTFLPLKGKSPAPLQLVEPQAAHVSHARIVQPPPPLSEAQKLAATANWVQQLPEPKERKQKIDKQDQKKFTSDSDTQGNEMPQASALTATGGLGAVGGGDGDDLNSLSEERIEEITRQLKGGGGVVCECPICGKVLHSRESDYGVLLHVELCLQQSEAAATCTN